MEEKRKKNPRFSMLRAHEYLRRWPWPPGDPPGPWPWPWPPGDPVVWPWPQPWPPGDPAPFIYKDLIEKLDPRKKLEIAKIRADYVQKVREAELSLMRQVQEIEMAHMDKMLQLQNEFNQKLGKVMG